MQKKTCIASRDAKCGIRKLKNISNSGFPNPCDSERQANERGPLGSDPLLTPSLTKCKRSWSLQDLSPSLERDSKLRRGGMAVSLMGMVEDSREESEGVEREKVKMLALKGYSAFLRNAWRRARDKSSENLLSIASLGKEIRNKNMQMTTLKYIIASDEQVVKAWAKEIQYLKTHLSQALADESQLRQAKLTLEDKVETMDEEMEKLKTCVMNERNTTDTLRSENYALDNQLNKEREKIAKLKKEIAELKSQHLEMKELKEEKEKLLEDLILKVDDLESKIDNQTKHLQFADSKIKDDARVLHETVEEIVSLRNQVIDYRNQTDSLTNENEGLRLSLKEKKEYCEVFEKFCHDQMTGIIEMQTEIFIYKSNNWMAKTVRGTIITLFKLPLALLEVVAFPQGSYLK